MRIGYACKNSVHGSTNKKITMKKLNELTHKEKLVKLCELTKKNLDNILNIILWNIDNDINMFRISHNCFPLLSHDDLRDWWKPLDIFEDEIKNIGKVINDNDIRVSLHPMHFCCLTSDNELILARSSYEIDFCANFLKIMQLNKVPDVVIHIGGKYNNPEKAVRNFEINFNKLNPYTKKVIRFENDHHIYNTLEVYEICKKLNVPMIFDIAHHKFNSGGLSEEDALSKAISTWPSELTPKIHLSSQSNLSNKHKHADYIEIDDIKPLLYRNFDIMLEAKATDLAFAKIRHLI